ncbi:hypothetical protein AHAS_Ahas19G0132300 [Arachis hypogaea]
MTLLHLLLHGKMIQVLVHGTGFNAIQQQEESLRSILLGWNYLEELEKALRNCSI